MAKYLVLEVLLPGGLVFFTWLPGQFLGLSNEAHLFLKVFASGDLLPICLLILIGAALRLERSSNALFEQALTSTMSPETQAAARVEWDKQRRTKWLAISFAAVTMVMYFVIKVNVLPYPFPASDVDAAMWVYGCTIIDVGAFVIVSVFGFRTAQVEMV